MFLAAPATQLDEVNQQRQEDQLLSENRRREIFLALVDAQDRKMGVLRVPPVDRQAVVGER